MPNRLAKETSPYLKQHADNPVDWYPWGAEALDRARSEDKPILLSVGYSACHWCHVMEHESFENDATAQLMNENFVNIKVDREERPDLDQVYQSVSQLMTRSGGWPLTVFLTPDLRPFFGGTYFPPEDRWGRPGFPKVLQALAEAYRSQKNDVLENAEKLTKAMRQMETEQNSAKQRVRPDRAFFQNVANKLMDYVDWKNGGFGSQPKFPNSMNLSFLWRYGLAADVGKATDAVILALEKMAKGGIYDQLGGGFHRYSVDATWTVPHFEKMLYDNGVLLKLYSEVLLTAPGDLLSKDQRILFENVLRQTSQWALREMRSQEGLFFSALDADSSVSDDEGAEKVEGKFYVWNIEELQHFLSADERLIFALRFGVSEHGNFEHKGENVLFQDYSIEEISKKLELDDASTCSLLESVMEKALHERSKKPRPALDHKCLLSWNALMISGLAWASVALQDDSLFNAACETMKAIESHFRMPSDKGLFSVWSEGKAHIPAYLDDYAFLSAAYLDLAKFTNTRAETAEENQVVHFNENARHWVLFVEKHFSDPDSAGYFFTSNAHEKLIVRNKTHHDQAIPSGTSVTLESLLALGEIFAEMDFLKRAEDQIFSLAPHLEENPFGLGELACAALLQTIGPVCVAPGSGVDFGRKLLARPHVFRQANDHGGGLSTVCHRQTCLSVNSGAEIPSQYLDPKLGA